MAPRESGSGFLSIVSFQLKKLVEKPKPVLKREENGDDVNGNIDISLDDEEEWQVSNSHSGF